MTQQVIWRGRVVELALEEATLPDGRRVELEMVRHPGGAAVVALDGAGRLALLRQWRHAAGGWLWELPAGKLEPGEPALETARRELAEEAGVTAGQWDGLGLIHSSPGVFNERIHLFLARDLHLGETAHEPHEAIEVHWVAFEQALEWAWDGTISDAKSLCGLLRARPYIGSGSGSSGSKG